MPAAKVPAACVKCDASYLVPADGRAHLCRSCGGQVLALVSPEALVPEEPEARPAAARGRPGRGEPADTRLEARRNLHRAGRFVRFLRFTYGVAAFIGLWVVLAMTRAQLDTPDGWLVKETLLAALVTAVAFCGAVLVSVRPFFWSVLAATAVTALGGSYLLFAGELRLGGFLHIVTWMLAFWLPVPVTWSVNRLLREVPDSYASHSLMGTSRKRRELLDEGASPEAFGDLLVATIHRKYWFASICSLLFLALVFFSMETGGGAASVRGALRSVPVEEAVEDFVGAWNRGDEPAVRAAFAPDRVDRWEAVQRALGATNGQALPAIVGSFIESDAGEAEVSFEIASGALTAQFELDRQSELGWVLTRLILPPAALEPRLEGFVEGWAAGDASAVAALAASDDVESMRGMLAGVAESRGWGAGWPVIAGDPTIEVVSDLAARATFALTADGRPAGEVTTNWKAGDDGRWNLAGLRPPP